MDKDDIRSEGWKHLVKPDNGGLGVKLGEINRPGPRAAPEVESSWFRGCIARGNRSLHDLGLQDDPAHSDFQCLVLQIQAVVLVILCGNKGGLVPSSVLGWNVESYRVVGRIP